MTGAIRGYFADLDDSDTIRCSNCGALPILPGIGIISLDPTTIRTDRDVDFWGIGAEARFGEGNTPSGAPPSFYRNDYFIIGGDVRGIDQDTRVAGQASFFNYREGLDTTYAGAYVGLGGEYGLGFLGLGGAMDRFGLRSFASARAGIYAAEAKYAGRYDSLVTDTQNLRLLKDKAAFIGTLSFETRKDFGPRTSLSLITDYEYYSWVPEMRYGPTRIDDGDAWSIRTVLRLNIGLGPKALYADPAPYPDPIK